MIGVFVWIRRNATISLKLAGYLTATGLVLIAWDLLTFGIGMRKESLSADTIGFNAPAGKGSAKLPNIYLIIADAYPGQLTLNDIYHHSNNRFYNDLKERGFYVADSGHSNYNFTEFSTASLLHMNYLKKIEGREVSLKHLGYCFETMKQSPFINYLQARGYEFNNYSIFDFPGNPSPVIPTLLPGRTKPVTEQTLSARLRKDIGYHLFTDIPFMAEWLDLEGAHLRNNQKLTSLTQSFTPDSRAKPTFTYTHLMMPHVPYYFDRNGTRLAKPIHDGKDTSAFFEYLTYTNRQLLSLVDSILDHAPTPPVILLLGDHGHRDYVRPVEQKFHFQTLVSVLLPNQNYESFYPTISHVNLLRTTVNSVFSERLPLLKDSTIFLTE